jgi:hypothetical protein
MMKEIDENKPAGWGLQKAKGEFTAGGDDADLMA